MTFLERETVMILLLSILLPMYVGIQLLDIVSRNPEPHPAVRLFAGVGVILSAVVIGLLINAAGEITRTLEAFTAAGF
jgi:hypothetical protein